MKKPILMKFLLLVIFHLFSYHLIATTYYYQGGTVTTNTNWKTGSTGSGTSPSTGTNFFKAGDIYDFNGRDGALNNVILRGADIQNSSTTAITISGSCTITAPTSFSNTGITYNFNGTTTTVTYSFASASTPTFPVYPFTYKNLTFTGGASFSGTGIIASGNTATVSGVIRLNGKGLDISGTLALSSTSSIFTTNPGTIYLSGSLDDSRATKIYPWLHVHNTSTSIASGQYSSFLLFSNASLGADVEINDLEIGDANNCFILNCSTYNLTIGNSLILSNNTVPSTPDSSGINCSNGTLIIKSNSLTLSASHFRTAIGTNNNSNLSNINNLIVECGDLNSVTISSEDFTGTSTYTNHLPTISGDCSIISGALSIDGGILTVNGNYTLSSNDGVIIQRTQSSDKLDLTNANSKLTISVDGSILSPLTYTAGDFKNNTIGQLMLNFTGGGIFTLPENLTITTETDLYDETNLLDINGKTLTINGSIISSSAATDGLLIGSATSSLVCGATGTLYFN